MSYKRPREVFEADNPQTEHSPYAVYGTALPPADGQARDDGSYVPVWKQEVTDERGRKRLHGAFTGGFSAGYFNTVGSKEGWAPSTFVSSRKERAKKPQQQRAEDFMDEEDAREVEESKTLETSDDFAGFGSTAADASRRRGVMDVFRPSGETMGVKLLKRMGWKEGQGIGPKVRRKADLGKELGTSGDRYLFAPENTAVVSFTRKKDTKGLGFEGEARLGADSAATEDPHNDREESGPGYGNNRLLTNTASAGKSTRRMRGGIGVGILNDDGSDEEDPYEIGPRISYNRVIDQDKKAKKKKQDTEGQRLVRGSNPLLNSKPVFISKKKAAADKTKPGFRKCHDGRLPLDGFLLGRQMAELNISDQAQRYAPPKIPEDWQSSKVPTTERDTSNYVSTADAAKASSHDPKSRAAVLGETQLPGKSVFDYMTPESRERLVRATGRTDLPPALSERPPKGFETSEVQKKRDLWSFVPKLEKDVATQALSRGIGGWMPYAEDESKRARYRAYLELQAGFREDLPGREPGTTTEAWTSELNEFARAAEVFKPMSGMMASRFTSSSSLPQSTESAESPLLRKPEGKAEDPAEEAARVGMYGPMTRLSLPFSPARLLCKRFNVRPPDSEAGTGDTHGGASESQAASASKLELVSKDTMARLMSESVAGGRPVSTTSDAEPSGQRPPEPERVVVDPDRNEALEAPRPGEEVFKAIFGSDNEDEE